MPLGSGLAIRLGGLSTSSHCPSSQQPQALETRSHAAPCKAGVAPALTPVSQHLPPPQAEVTVTRHCPHSRALPLLWRGWEGPSLILQPPWLRFTLQSRGIMESQDRSGWKRPLR